MYLNRRGLYAVVPVKVCQVFVDSKFSSDRVPDRWRILRILPPKQRKLA
jgi:hypothetical protein